MEGRVNQQRTIRQMISTLASPSVEYCAIWLISYEKYKANLAEWKQRSIREKLVGHLSLYGGLCAHYVSVTG